MDSRIDFMRELAREAGKILMGFYGTDMRYRLKIDNSIVTEADLKVSSLVHKAITEQYPGDGILNEEGYDSKKRLDKKGIWIVDPLDGSSDFRKGDDDFSFLLAYAYQGIPMLGIVAEPKKERLTFAQKGEGAFMEQNGETSRLPPLQPIVWEEAIVGHPKNHPGKKYGELYGLLGIPQERIRGSGGMGTRMMQLALGEAHLILGYTKGLKEWDCAAGHVILEEQGISVTDMFGNDLLYNKPDPVTPKGILAVHPGVKEITLEKLALCYDRVKM